MNLKQEDKQIQAQLAEGWRLFVLGRWEESLRVFQAVLQLEPETAMANSLTGACLMRLGHFDEAEAFAREGISLMPHVAFAHTILAEVLSVRENYVEAESEYWEAVALNPDAPGPQIDLGRFLIFQGRHREARTHVARAINASSEDPDAHYLMSICNIRDENVEEALKEIELAIQFAPDSSVVWHFRGMVLVGRARDRKKKREKVVIFRDSAESLRKALELNPGNISAKHHLQLMNNAIAATEQYLDSVAELKSNWWQVPLAIGGLVVFAIVNRSFWIDALFIAIATSSLVVWRNRRRILGLGPDPFDSIRPLQLVSSGFPDDGIPTISAIEPINEWLN
jgi:tetratricopeptide (TPR) repeat protein